MYEQFTDRARRVFQLANEEAQRFNHEYIGTEHILLGLIKEGSGVAANVLKNLDIDLRRIRFEIEKLVQSGPDMVTAGKLPQTSRAKKVIEYAIEEARNLGHNYVGTEHILLGLIREREGVAAQVLANLGLKLETLREEILNLLGRGVVPTTSDIPLESDTYTIGKPGQFAQLPATCPKCGGSRIVRILWDLGHLSCSRQIHDELAAGPAMPMRYRLTVGRKVPAWVCLTCDPRWEDVQRLSLQEYQWQTAKEEAVASEDYETAIRLRDSQRDLRPRLMALVEDLLGGP